MVGNFWVNSEQAWAKLKVEIVVFLCRFLLQLQNPAADPAALVMEKNKPFPVQMKNVLMLRSLFP